MLKPAKQPHIRLTALFLCVTMFLSTLFFNAHTAYAADGTIDYKAGAKIPYGDYYTSRMSFQDCLVVDMERIEDTPIIYNTITQTLFSSTTILSCMTRRYNTFKISVSVTG